MEERRIKQNIWVHWVPPSNDIIFAQLRGVCDVLVERNILSVFIVLCETLPTVPNQSVKLNYRHHLKPSYTLSSFGFMGFLTLKVRS